MSRGKFLSTDISLRPWKTPHPTPKESINFVYDRLCKDPSQRIKAQKKLKSIVQKKTSTSSTTLDENSDKKRRSLSKLEINKMVNRLQAFWDNKWMKIEKKRKEIAEKQEKEFKLTIKKTNTKSNPEIFKRLITPRSVEEPVKKEEKKFTIREAIESGKKLMNSRNVKNHEKLSSSPKEFNGGLKLNTEPSPTRKSLAIKTKNIEEFFSKCKEKNKLKESQSPRSFNLSMSCTQKISYLPNRTSG